MKRLVGIFIALSLALVLASCVKHTHTFSEEWTSDATSHWHAATCEHAEEVNEKAEHTWDAGKVTLEPTEQAEGKKVFTCTVCQYQKEEKIEKLTHEHTWVDATCTAPKICSKCNATEGEALGHTPAEAVKEKEVAATCKEAGSYDLVVYCSVAGCGAEISREAKTVAKLEHDYDLTAWGFKSAEGHAHMCKGCEAHDTIVAHTPNISEPTENDPVKCSVCEYVITPATGHINHTPKEEWVNNETHHWHECVGCSTEKVGYAEHAWGTGVITTDPTCTEKGVKTYTCECGKTKTEEVDSLGHTYSTDWLNDDTYHWHQATCEHSTEISEKAKHSYDNTGKCVCGKEVSYLLLGSHAGTSQWDMTADEKISSNAIFHQNVSNVAVDGEGNIADFSLQIQYKGWENNGERGYFFTIKSENGVLTLDNQLGISPWGYTTFTLKEEHKTRLASAEGLDFVVQYNHEEQKLQLYIYTNHKLEKLYEMNTYYGSMSNFYKFVYKLTGTATVNTTTYKTYDTSIDTMYEELGLALTEHDLFDVAATEAGCTTTGVVAHKECTMCDVLLDAEGNILEEVIPMVGHIYDEETQKCKNCEKVNPFTFVSTHEGTSQWDMAVEEKISSNAIFHQNVSNVTVDDEGNIVDFSLQIQYKGYENNEEKAYFFTIKSENGVLTLDNQLGISPWGYTTFTLKEEHKTRLASAEGLDFFVCYEHNNQKLALYIVTDGNIEKLYAMKTYFGKMANFYKFVYKLTGTATVNTTTYTVSSEFDPMTDLLNK